MAKKQKPGINNGQANSEIPRAPTEEEKTEEIRFFVTPHEMEFIASITSILSKIDVNGTKVLRKNEISELVRTCITYTCGLYTTNLFPDSNIVTKLPDKDSVKEFIAFRKKFMNYPLDAQINQLKEMGIVKQKQQQQQASQD